MFKKITVPFRRFAHVHVDLVGPLPPSHGYTYFLTCIDRSTCWPEVIHLVWISSAEYASAMFHEWISRFGVPTIITSDRGTQFTSSLWSAICSLLNIRQNLTTTFHFQSKGIIERFHRQLKKFSMISPGLLRLVWALTLDFHSSGHRLFSKPEDLFSFRLVWLFYWSQTLFCLDKIYTGSSLLVSLETILAASKYIKYILVYNIYTLSTNLYTNIYLVHL